MGHEVRIVENIDWLEVYPNENFDRGRINPEIVEEYFKNEIRHVVKAMMESFLEFERDLHINAIRYERGIMERDDYRNGYRQRDLSTSMGTFRLKVPRGRKPIEFSLFETYSRRWREVDNILLEAHIGGISCRNTGQRLARLLGSAYSAQTISTLTKKLMEKLRALKNAPLNDKYVALVIDAMYVRIRQCGTKKRPVVVVLGITENGDIDMLSLRVCESENSTEVEAVLRTIKERGLTGHKLQLVTIDGDKGLEAAVYAVYGNVRIQTCIFHKINRIYQNANGKARARKMMHEVSKIFKNTDNRKKRKELSQFCDTYRQIEPRAIECFEKKLDRCFEVNMLPDQIRSLASTTSLCENLFMHMRARLNRIGAFETPSAVEIYVYAVASRRNHINIPGRTVGESLLHPFTHFS